jgi:guanosine-3',5'-bis(diphosphate) 3'-pyrophosphohydrolase
MKIGDQDTGLILAAVKFAADRHRDQRRKGVDAVPYINHPIEVAALLWETGATRNASTIVAALLHDVIEDTKTAPEEIEQLFGSAILSLVLELTDDKSLPKAKRKSLQITDAPHKSPEAKLIKIADKICNLRDISGRPPKDWSFRRKLDYLDWSEKVVEGLRGSNAQLEALFDQTLHACRVTLLEEATTDDIGAPRN